MKVHVGVIGSSPLVFEFDPITKVAMPLSPDTDNSSSPLIEVSPK